MSLKLLCNILLLFISIALLPKHLCCQTLHYTQRDTVFSIDGHIESISIRDTKRPRDPDAWDSFRKNKRTITRYYPDGSVSCRIISIYRYATWGRRCNELSYRRKEYDKEGRLIKNEHRSCDRKRSVEISYFPDNGLKEKSVRHIRRYHGEAPEQDVLTEQTHRAIKF